MSQHSAWLHLVQKHLKIKNTECRFDERRSVECCYAECDGAKHNFEVKRGQGTTYCLPVHKFCRCTASPRCAASCASSACQTWQTFGCRGRRCAEAATPIDCRHRRQRPSTFVDSCDATQDAWTACRRSKTFGRKRGRPGQAHVRPPVLLRVSAAAGGGPGRRLEIYRGLDRV
jgi:hypothetical protein